MNKKQFQRFISQINSTIKIVNSSINTFRKNLTLPACFFSLVCIQTEIVDQQTRPCNQNPYYYQAQVPLLGIYDFEAQIVVDLKSNLYTTRSSLKLIDVKS